MRANDKRWLFTLAVIVVTAMFAVQLLGLRVAFGAAAVLLAVHLARSALRRRRRRGAPRSGQVAVELFSPPSRYGPRQPVPLETLRRMLDGIGVGQVSVEEQALLLDEGEGRWARLVSSTPQAVVLVNVRVEASSAVAALVLCDALVPLLGPMTVTLDGVEMFLDGTTPRRELEVELRRRQRMREAQLAHTLGELAANQGKPPPRGPYLH
ncbi:MAG: hypothetical protein ACOZIN_08715 [Myxococcota bacterium]